MGIGTYGPPIRRGNLNTITIGNYCSLAEGLILDSGFNHRHDYVSTYPFNRLWSELDHNIEHPADITIGSDVWIGEEVMILAGCEIKDGTVIGARSLLTKNTKVGPYEIWAGTPARFIKKRFSENIIQRLLKLKWWDKSEKEIEKIAPLLMSNRIEELLKLYDL